MVQKKKTKKNDQKNSIYIGIYYEAGLIGTSMAYNRPLASVSIRVQGPSGPP